MFNFFKKNSNKINPEDEAKTLMVIQLIEPGLKNVEKKQLLGNEDEADKLLESITEAAAKRLIGNKNQVTAKLFSAQYDAVLFLLGHLHKSKKHSLTNLLINKITENISDYNELQINQLSYYIDLELESLNVIQNSDNDVRLIFYICQRCGVPNLIVMSPCMLCGFISRNEKEIRRAFLLSAGILEAPFLLSVGKAVYTSIRSNPQGPAIDKIWASGDLDEAANEHTQYLNAEIPEFIKKCEIISKMEHTPESLLVMCPICGSTQTFDHMKNEHYCIKCKATISIPYFLRLKALLFHVQIGIMLYCDHPRGVIYNNLIAKIVELTDYAISRNISPDISQGNDLISRFENMGNLSYFGNRYTVTFKNNKATGILNDGKDTNPEIDDEFSNQESLLNMLFSLLHQPGFR